MTVSDSPPYYSEITTDFPRITATSLPSSTLKRAIDLAICFFVLPYLLVIIPFIALLIALESPGSPIFIQERIGYNGKRFRIYKIRTLVKDRSDQSERDFMRNFIAGRIEPTANAVHKPIPKHHLTPLGKFLRKSSLDELPQIFNVLKGEMSLIGPRPNVPWEVESYKPWHYERLNALPGITGLAQVLGRSSLSFDQIARLDIRYVRSQSTKLDLWIVWQTLKTVLTGRGAG